MIRIAIVEDDIRCAGEIAEYLDRYSAENDVEFRISVFHDGDEIVAGYQGDFDILLMDIELPLLNGMEASKEIRGIDRDVEIIFITNSPQYAIQGYRVGALDYILKPVNYYAFSQTITRAIERNELKQERSILVNVKGGRQKIIVRKIRFVEVRDHDLTFHTEDGDISARGTIRDAMEELEGHGFFHCNKGYLINLAFVDSISGHDIKMGKDIIPVGRTRKKAFMEALNKYMSSHSS
ncbi:MAG: response regulator transcription factor [Lachnospiraceae bacterium]|nr:response regulator transcription factor [Lachnospiraceae bacterium]